MAKFIKIVIYTFWFLSLYITNLWIWGICISLLLSLICIKYNDSSIKLLFPLTLAIILFVTSSYFWFILFLLSIYLYRCILNDFAFNSSNLYISFIILALAFLLTAPTFVIYPMLMLSLTIPIYKIDVLYIKQKHTAYIILVILLIASIVYVVHDSNTGKRAYLHHGVWANSTYQYHVDSLQSKGTYSYSELVKLLMADTISSMDIDVLEKYTELWIITPTKPFVKEELEHLKEWVFKGGKLIVSSDHTDLFGHARCCNQIASLFNCEIGISATYDADNRQYFRDSRGDYYLFKTGTSFSGFAFPMWSTWLWEEDAYYMENNFFGPLSPSGDDLFSIKIMLAQVPYGLGEVSFIQDSTIFANFCVFQPGTLDLIKQLSSHSFFVRVYSLPDLQ